VCDRPGSVVIAIDEPGQGESVGERDEHARHLGDRHPPGRAGSARGKLERVLGELGVACVLGDGERMPLRRPQGVLRELEHRLLVLGVGFQVLEVPEDPGLEDLAKVAAGYELGDDGLLLAGDDRRDQFVDELVARVERVVEARERHAGLGDDRTGRGLPDTTS
jgi:hypothetical protein